MLHRHLFWAFSFPLIISQPPSHSPYSGEWAERSTLRTKFQQKPTFIPTQYIPAYGNLAVVPSETVTIICGPRPKSLPPFGTTQPTLRLVTSLAVINAKHVEAHPLPRHRNPRPNRLGHTAYCVSAFAIHCCSRAVVTVIAKSVVVP